MQPKWIEREVIAACLSEDKYEKCSFLQESDFEHYGEVWQFIDKHKGDFVSILEDFQSIGKYSNTLLFVSVWKPERLALKILEYSFQRSLLDLLSSLGARENDSLEAMKINSLQTEVIDLDIMGVVESFPDYAKLTKNKKNYRSIDDWSNNCKKRIDGVKAIY